MKKIIQALTNKNTSTGYLGFYIHLVTETICFYNMAHLIGDSFVLWFFPLLYDLFAFVPQGIMGYINDKFNKFNITVLGFIIMAIATGLFYTNIHFVIKIIVLAIGNACTHVGCANDTLRTSEGKMTSSAFFVAGGSFGIVCGKLFAKYGVPVWMIIIMLLSAIPCALLSGEIRQDVKKNDKPLAKFNYHNESLSPWVVLLGAFFIVIIRGFMGYGIPTSWNKTDLQMIMLFGFMGIGKAFGGVFIDAFGIKKTAIYSMIVSLPLLCFGDTVMTISLIGVMFFSMTMAVTLALCASVIKSSPGLAFGVTTTGLFLGSAPVFFFRVTTLWVNQIMLVVVTIICILIACKIIKKEVK